MEELREETIRFVRSCLVIVKGSLEMRQLDKDYRTFINQSIPFRKLGYNTLEDFLRSIDSLQVRKMANGDVLVDAKIDEASAHISAMVARQKTKTKKRPAVKKYSYATNKNYTPQIPKVWRPVNVMRGYAAPNYVISPRIAQHNQFMTSPRRAPVRTQNNHVNVHAHRHPQATNYLSQPLPQNVSMHDFGRMHISPPLQPPKPVAVANKENQKPKPVQTTPPPPVVKNVVKPVKKPVKPADDNTPKKSRASDGTNLHLVMQRANQRMNGVTPNGCNVSSNHSNGVRSEHDAVLEDQREFEETGNVPMDLYNFTQFWRINYPRVIVSKRKVKNKPVHYDCKIKFDEGTPAVSSYPDDCFDEATATFNASKKALDKLIAKYGKTHKQSLPIAHKSSIHERVPPLVGKHYNGVWSWQVEADYKDLYNEILPSDWLDIIGKYPTIAVEKFVDRFVVRVCQPEDRLQKTLTHCALACDVSIPTSSATFDNAGLMSAKVTCPVSAGEIWFRQIGTEESESFDRMCEDMNRYYQQLAENNTEMPADRFVKGHFYAVWDECWHRAEALEVFKDGLMCHFVDRGDDCFIPLKMIFTLHRQYARERAQAFVCRLTGLDDFYEVSKFCDIIGELDESEVTLETTDEADDQTTKKIFSVVMYDPEEGTACNYDIMALLAVQNATHKFELDKPFEMHVSHILADKPDFYMQIHGPGFKYLMNALKELENDLRTKLVEKRTSSDEITRENSKDVLYFAKLGDDTQYYRVRIIDADPEFKHVQVRYVDIGSWRIITLSKEVLMPLDELKPALAKFPPQALLAHLHLERVPNDLPTKFKNSLPGDGPVWCKIQSITDDCPSVMLFVRNESGGLVSINDSLIYETYNGLISPCKFTPPDSPRSIMPTTGVLPAPIIPTFDSFFEVKVLFADNPSNFFVQPLVNVGRLVELMGELDKTYSDDNNQSVALEDVKVGNIYAAQRKGAWYRVSVINMVYPTAIVCFFVDYGFYSTLRYYDLYYLRSEYMQLPYQAIKAKLAGVKPKQDKWSLEEGIFFSKLVEKREYVSVICNVEKDELNPCDDVLVLKLIDTSDLIDLHIIEHLIDKNIAVRV